jgi:oligopeptide/dipeptide ABC transporter ATP-binding protein
MSQPVLEVRNLSTHFFTRNGVVPAVEGLSLAVATGQVAGLVGESGCGKSTAALSIMRLVPPPGRIVAGQILLDGIDLAALDEDALCDQRGRQAAMIFQDALIALNPTMTVGDQVGEPMRRHLGLSATEARRLAVELLHQVGIPDAARRAGDYPHQFSGGMRQRVMIAMALSCSPKLLIADEPVTALDVTIQRQILDLIMALRERTGTGVLLITHDVDVVAETCDRVTVMYAGRAVESGPTEAVFTRPRHPYTAGLLGSTLGAARRKDQPLPAIPGLPPDLANLPPGCPFAPRCARRAAECLERRPDLEPAGEDRLAACWRPEGE